MKIVAKFARSPAHRRMMMRNLVTNLIEHNQIKTTVVKAKEVRRHADKMVGLAKQGTLHARRLASAFITKPNVVSKLFTEFPDKYKDRAGGFTRIFNAGLRNGDRAQMAIIEYLTSDHEKKEKKSKYIKPVTSTNNTNQTTETKTETKEESK
eukprot:TRINITY_DN7037_c0_g1_i1.p1 TRINITY_DN7037_c0_g1~~TRINITY_DN7037_c0_g1_i1.p1  ORF type:complete len:152 (-),score=39.29 TRINITY_DN7037_c0_g1_i1:86-541(-)